MDRITQSFQNIDLSVQTTTKNVLIVYGTEAGICAIVYGYRYGVKALRQFFINEKQNPQKVEASTPLDAVLYGTLTGVAKGFIPSFFGQYYSDHMQLLKLTKNQSEHNEMKSLK